MGGGSVARLLRSYFWTDPFGGHDTHGSVQKYGLWGILLAAKPYKLYRGVIGKTVSITVHSADKKCFRLLHGPHNKALISFTDAELFFVNCEVSL